MQKCVCVCVRNNILIYICKCVSHHYCFHYIPAYTDILFIGVPQLLTKLVVYYWLFTEADPFEPTVGPTDNITAHERNHLLVVFPTVAVVALGIALLICAYRNKKS